MNIKTIDGVELETKKETLVYRGKEIRIDKDMPGDKYALSIEREFGSKLKTCINCKYFEYTPLSIDMGGAFKGRCLFREKAAEKARKAWFFKPKNYDEMQRPDYGIVSIFFCCDHFEFEPYSEEKKKNVMEKAESVFLSGQYRAEKVLKKIAMAVCVLRENGIDRDLLRKFTVMLRKNRVVQKRKISSLLKRRLAVLFLEWSAKHKIEWSEGNGEIYLFFTYIHIAVAKLLKLNKSAEEIVFEIATKINIYGREGVLFLDEAIEYYSFRMSRALKYLLHVEALELAGLDKKVKDERLYRKGRDIIEQANDEMRFFGRERVARAKKRDENLHNEPNNKYMPARDFMFYLDSEKERDEIKKLLIEELGAKTDDRGSITLDGNYVEIKRNKKDVPGSNIVVEYNFDIYVICSNDANTLSHQRKLAKKLERFFKKIGKTSLVSELFMD
ncbi:MAG: hypothetical protein NTW67_02480 [Candidatus Woesearchaeota archaeon]|nr:hypothetical protein [Candidatus Woesearchaeota archaeon]